MQLVLLVQPEHQVQVVVLELQEQVDLLVHRVMMDLMAQVVHQELQVMMEMQVHQDHQVLQVHQVQVVHLVHLDQMVQMDQVVLQV